MTTIENVSVSEWAQSAGELEWLWERTIPLGHIAIMQAAQKVGKSTLVRNLIRHVVTGEEFLGREVKKGKVLYLPLEENPSSVRDHFGKLGILDDENIIIPHCQGKMVSTIQELGTAIEQYEPILVVIDPLILFVKEAALSNYDKVYNAMYRYVELAMKHKCSIVFIHHESKSAQKNIGQRGMGSTAFPAVASSTISLSNRSGQRLIELEGRDIEAFDGMVIELDENGIVSGKSYADVQIDKFAPAILAAFECFDSPPSMTELLPMVEGDIKEVKYALLEMVKSRAVVHVSGKGLRGDPKRYGLPPVEEEADPEEIEDGALPIYTEEVEAVGEDAENSSDHNIPAPDLLESTSISESTSDTVHLEKLMPIFKNASQSLTVDEITEGGIQIGMKPFHVQKALKEAENSAFVTVFGKGKRGNPKRYQYNEKSRRDALPV